MSNHLFTYRVLLCTTIGAVVMVWAAVALSQASVAAEPKYQFQQGFAALAEAVPGVVGEPVEDEHYAANGDSLQATTTGMMAWRKADNWTAFTDGARTWINGPNGVEVRSNDERFAWESAASPSAAQSTDDPFLYCAMVGTVDRPDERYTGPTLPESVRQGLARALGVPAEGIMEGNTVWRCMDNQVVACTVGANLNCGQANTSREPTSAMRSYCQENPESDFIPLVVVGHEGIYSWRCQAGEPVIERQAFHVDPRGFVAEFWHTVIPPGDRG